MPRRALSAGCCRRLTLTTASSSSCTASHRGRATGELPPYAVPTEKYIAVCEGQLTVYVDNRPHVVKSGDSIYFEVKSPYRLVNDDGHRACMYYMVIVRKR